MNKDLRAFIKEWLEEMRAMIEAAKEFAAILLPLISV